MSASINTPLLLVQDRNIGILLTLEYRFARVTNKQKEAPEEAHATDPRMHL